MILLPFTLYCIKLNVKFSSWIKCIPYEIDMETGFVREFPSPWKRGLWHLSSASIWIFSIGVYTRLYQLLKSTEFEDLNLARFSQHLGWAAGCTTLIIGHICVCHRRRGIVTFLNQFFTYIQNMDKGTFSIHVWHLLTLILN